MNVIRNEPPFGIEIRTHRMTSLQQTLLFLNTLFFALYVEERVRVRRGLLGRSSTREQSCDPAFRKLCLRLKRWIMRPINREYFIQYGLFDSKKSYTHSVCWKHLFYVRIFFQVSGFTKKYVTYFSCSLKSNRFLEQSVPSRYSPVAWSQSKTLLNVSVNRRRESRSARRTLFRLSRITELPDKLPTPQVDATFDIVEITLKERRKEKKTGEEKKNR